MENNIPDFWLPGRLITAAANRADLAEWFDFAELFDLAELFERVDLADLVVSDLVDKALHRGGKFTFLVRWRFDKPLSRIQECYRKKNVAQKMAIFHLCAL